MALIEALEILVGYILLKGVLPLIILALFTSCRKEKRGKAR